ncbi:cytochrome-c peroxidase [Paracoccus kondratievae]
MQHDLTELGQRLFHDPALSRNGTQSCATCHDPEYAFTDPREGVAGRAVSLGDDGVSYGDRNTPTLSYAALSPSFHRDAKGRYKGGQFWDGRADDLEDQAGQPMLNPVEMAMTDKAAVVARLRDEQGYQESFAALLVPARLMMWTGPSREPRPRLRPISAARNSCPLIPALTAGSAAKKA